MKQPTLLLTAILLTTACQTVTREQIDAESAKANVLFDQLFDEQVARSPMTQTWLGMKTDYDKWDDLSDEFEQQEHELTKQELARLRQEIDYDLLDEQTQTSYDLFVMESERKLDGFKYRFHNYPLEQMFGWQSQVPSFLISMHGISDSGDAKAYISRLEGVDLLFSQLIAGLRIRDEMGITPPRFVFDHVLRDCQNIMTGSSLIDDFKSKIADLDLTSEEQRDLTLQAEAAIQNSVVPAYERLIAYVKTAQETATDDEGVWKLPEGEDFYNFALKRVTTTNLTANQIHDIGLDEVARIHGEMEQIKNRVGFSGTLQDFFEFMRTDDRFFYPDTDAGREAYMAKATAILDSLRNRLGELFITVPKASMEIKRVEPFREKSAGTAFYQSPALDGSRPGRYYVNLYDMREMPIYQMEALAYHEGIPGHHMQRAISQEIEGLPKFRRLASFTAYNEGWGLYSELIPKEMGLYEDPHSDFGRLAGELWRACRLVVDTGIHAKKWTRAQGIEYYRNNTPNPEGDCIKMVERHVVMPGQATAYKIGMLKILELRRLARQKLGDDFDIREFHEVILNNGAMPLTLLEKTVAAWIGS